MARKIEIYKPRVIDEKTTDYWDSYPYGQTKEKLKLGREIKI